MFLGIVYYWCTPFPFLISLENQPSKYLLNVFSSFKNVSASKFATNQEKTGLALAGIQPDLLAAVLEKRRVLYLTKEPKDICSSSVPVLLLFINIYTIMMWSSNCKFLLRKYPFICSIKEMQLLSAITQHVDTLRILVFFFYLKNNGNCGGWLLSKTTHYIFNAFWYIPDFDHTDGELMEKFSFFPIKKNITQSLGFAWILFFPLTMHYPFYLVLQSLLGFLKSKFTVPSQNLKFSFYPLERYNIYASFHIFQLVYFNPPMQNSCNKDKIPCFLLRVPIIVVVFLMWIPSHYDHI